MLFGAGHVGAALVRVLATLPCHVTWVDERDAAFPAPQFVPDNVTIEPTDAPDEAIDHAPPNAYFIAKKKQFEHRLAARGIDPLRIDRMVCPIGIDGIVDKTPEVIAVAAAAQLLQAVEANASTHASNHASSSQQTV